MIYVGIINKQESCQPLFPGYESISSSEGGHEGKSLITTTCNCTGYHSGRPWSSFGTLTTFHLTASIWLQIGSFCEADGWRTGWHVDVIRFFLCVQSDDWDPSTTYVPVSCASDVWRIHPLLLQADKSKCMDIHCSRAQRSNVSVVDIWLQKQWPKILQEYKWDVNTCTVFKYLKVTGVELG